MPQTVGQYLGQTKGPVINQHAVSDDYRARYSATFDSTALTFGRYLAEGNPDESFPEWKERMVRDGK